MTDWQPIETAPKDGTRILAFEPTPLGYKPEWCGVMTAAFGRRGWNADPCEASEYDPDVRGFTMWQPLPKLPEL